MNIRIFSNTKTIVSHFQKSRSILLQFLPADDFKKVLKSNEKDFFLYIDISKYDHPERNRLIRYISKLEGYRYGIIDPKGDIKDIATLFHNGASDYIGKELYKEGISTIRIKNALQYFAPGIAEAMQSKQIQIPKKFISSGSDWNSISADQEYTFCLMYIELDNYTELKKNLGEDRVHAVVSSFREFIENLVSFVQGRVWVWNESNGLILFPFDGKKCDAILTCFRLILSKTITETYRKRYHIFRLRPETKLQ